MKNMPRPVHLFILIAMLFALAFSLSACGDDDDDNDDATPGDDDTVDDDDTGDDDDNDDATPDDDDTADDDTVDDDTSDDDTGDDDTGDDDVTPVLGCVEGEFDPYWGNLHSHTTYSDGEGIPSDAFEMARDQAGLDIMIVSDHLEQLYFPFPKERYQKCLAQADDFYAPGDYLADCGFEYGSGFILPWFQSTGHNNVFFSPTLFPIITLDFHNFYDILVDNPGTVGQFNHPYDDPFQHWNHFEYFEDVDVQMNLMEFSGTDIPWEAYVEALDAGWHVSPMYNQDNHSADWGIKNDRRSGFFMADLTREDLYEAMMARRSFMSYDKNASLRIMADETCWMGSILSGYASLTIDIEAFDADAGDGFDVVEIYGPDSTLLDTLECEGATLCTGSFDYAITESTYFVAKAIQDDTDYLVAAPIWVAP